MLAEMRLLFLSLAVAVPAFAQEGRPSQGAGGPLNPAQLLKQFDRNGDGRIGRDEAPERMLGRWDNLDTDRDQFVTLEELQARDARVAGGGRPGPVENTPARVDPLPAPSAQAAQAGELSVVTVGTGSPRYDPERAGPCALVRCQGRAVLVDMGNGSQGKLSALGVSPRDLDALILTHHHLDHDEEFIPWFLHTRLAGARPEIVGPPGTKKLVDFATTFYAEDIAYRLRRSGRGETNFPAAMVREVQGGEKFALGALKVATARVNHTIHTVAYRFEAGGRSIVISGDLSYSEGLVDLARGADVLVMDSGGAIVRAGAAGRAGGERSGPAARSGGGGRPGDREAAHASGEDVATMAQKAGVRKLVLTHIAPGEVDEEATAKTVGAIFKGEVLVGRDGLEVTAGGSSRTAEAPAEPRGR